MLRRTFLTASTALGLTACAGGSSESERNGDIPPDFRVFVIDDESTFRDTGQPYLRALWDAGRFSERAGVEPIELSDYGRDEGVTVRGPVVAVADERSVLEQFFEGQSPGWRLPPTHRLGFSYEPWPDQSESLRWGARVMWADPVVTPEHVIGVEADDDDVAIRLNLTGAQRFEAMSGTNVGRRLAFVVDDIIVAAAVINQQIPGGLIRITLQGGPKAHRELAARFRSTAPQ